MPLNESWTGDLHILLLHEVSEDDGWEYELLHPSSCKEVPDERFNLHEGKVMVTKFDCDVAWMEYESSLADAISYGSQEITSPGCYRVRGWGTKYYDYEYGWEYDDGISVVGV